MLTRFKSLSVFYKYIISYCIISIIPLAIFITFFYNNSISSLRRDVESLNTQRLKQVQDSFEASFRELHKTAFSIMVDERLKPNYLNQSQTNVIGAASCLKSYSSSSNFVDETFYYLRDSNNIYAEDGTMSIEALTDVKFRFEPEDKANFIEMINVLKVPSVIPARKVKEDNYIGNSIFTFLYPIPVNSSKPYGTVMFFIEEGTILKLFNDVLGGFDGSSFILDNNMTPIISRWDSVLNLDDVVAHLNKSEPSGIYETVLHGQRQSVIYTTSSTSGWKYVISIPTDQFLSKVIMQRNLLYLISIIIIILGSCLGLVLALANYKPIKCLITDVGLLDKKHAGNEIDRIKTSLTGYMDINKSLKQLVDLQLPYVRECVMELLLDGRIRDEEARRLLKGAGVKFDKQYYMVIVLDCIQSQDEVMLSRFRHIIIGITMDTGAEWLEGCSICAIERAFGNIVALVVNFSDVMDEKALSHAIINGIEEIGRECFGENLLLGTGNIYEGISSVKKSFLEAMAAVEYSRIKGIYGIMYFRDIVFADTERYWYPMDEQMRFIQGVKQGNIVMALQSLEEICTSIAGRSESILMLKYICFDIINSVIKVINEILPDGFSHSVKNTMTFNCLDEFKKAVEVLVCQLCDYINSVKTSSNTNLRDNMLKYVDENFMDSNLCLESIAESFNLSPYYVSRFFSEQMNSTFKDYIASLRIDKAKKMLKTSALPMNDIVSKVGYFNASSFIRKFRKSEGMTPGDYRRIYTQESQIKSGEMTQELRNTGNV